MFYILTTSDWGAYFKRVLALLHIARTTVVTIAIAVERLLLFVGFAANVFQLHVYNNLKVCSSMHTRMVSTNEPLSVSRQGLLDVPKFAAACMHAHDFYQ
eukprot:1160464-Pelagomonas_calceolata.AAC.17